MRKTETLSMWRERIEACKMSGMNVFKWCNDNQISRHAYYYWHKKIKDMKVENNKLEPIFVEVQKKVIPAEEVTSCEGLEVSWKDFKIKITNENVLPMVVELLNRLGD